VSVAALRAGFARLMPTPPGGPLPLAIPRRRIYIVPSRFGTVYGAALFFLLLGSLNYNNNAAILLALLLGMVAMASAFAAVRFLSGISVLEMRCAEVFAGDAQDCLVRVGARHGAVAGDLTLRHDAVRTEARIDADGTAIFAWRWPTERRGRRRTGRIRLSTTYPLGLFYAWSILEPDGEAIVYPAPESPTAALPLSHEQSGRQSLLQHGEDDWHALREFQRGDSLRDIAWKVSARHDRWLVNETRNASQAPTLQFSLDQVAMLDREPGISRLTAWILAAETRQLPYALRIGNRTFGPDIGSEHRQRVLAALADLP
jgi:uncharacterized protein (DUF58 family)